MRRLTPLLSTAAFLLTASLTATAQPQGRDDKPAVAALPRFTVLSLGPSGRGGASVFDFNAKGTLLGTTLAAPGAERPAAWLRSHARGDEPIGRTAGIAPADLNDNDWVVGNGIESGGVVWSPQDGVVQLGKRTTLATAINNRNQVVGHAEFPPHPGRHAFLWDKATGLRDLGDLGRNHSVAQDVNDSGHVVGAAPTPDGGRAFLWTPQKPMRVLADLPPGAVGSAATALNNKGHVVGDLRTPEGSRPFFWSESGGMIALAVLPNSLGGGTARDVNDDDWVIGHSAGAGPGAGAANANAPPAPFLWTPASGTHDLNDLLAPGDKGWTILTATRVGPGGDILCTATKDAATHYVLLRPEGAAPAFQPAPPPAADAVAADPARRELDERLDAVAREIALLRETQPAGGSAAAAYAQRLERELQPLRDELAGKPVPDAGPSAAPELYVVGVYSGVRPQGAGKFGTAAVELEATGRPVVLALSAYEPVRWELRVAPGVRLERIILGGYHDQELATPAPKGVPVEEHTSDARSPTMFFAYKRNDPESHPRTVEALRTLTGLEITTLQGAPTYPGKPFVVGPRDPDWRNQRVAMRLEPLWREATARLRAASRQTLAGVTLPAIRWPSADDLPAAPAGAGAGGPAQIARMRAMRDMQMMRQGGELSRFTAAGWDRKNAHPLPRRVNRVAVDPRGPTYYGIEWHTNVVRIDLNAGAATQMKLGDNVPELSWPDGVAFDTKRNRLLLSSHGGGGYLYAYDPAADAWSVLREMDGVDLLSLAYSADEDCLYGLKINRRDGRTLGICRFDANGKPLGDLDADVPLLVDPMQQHDSPPQLLVFGGRLTILAAPPSPRGEPFAAAGPMNVLVLDPKTGRVLESGPLRDAPAAPAAAGAGARPAADVRALRDLWTRLRDADADDAAKLIDELAAHGDAAVAAVRVNLPPAPTPPTPEAIKTLLARLDGAEWKDREDAAEQLASLAAAEPDVRKARAAATTDEARVRLDGVLKQLQTLRETKQTEAEQEAAAGDTALRARLRAIRVLARAATPAAVLALREIAAGPPTAPDTARAIAALQK